jgi:plasmid stabilization system protein ParE
VKIEWAPFALLDRIAILDYIEADNPRAALSIDEHIKGHVVNLVPFP